VLAALAIDLMRIQLLNESEREAKRTDLRTPRHIFGTDSKPRCGYLRARAGMGRSSEPTRPWRPSVEDCGREIHVEGQLPRIARLDRDKYKFVDDPGPLLTGLRKFDTRVDLFTFMQKLPDRAPKYSCPKEWDNLAALPVSTFENWWTDRGNYSGGQNGNPS